MSEYQYYEFCSIYKPLTKRVKEIMHELSSRARVGTHGAAYAYNYSDFPGDPIELLLDYFDVYFYIANWGTVELMFKYPSKEVSFQALRKKVIEDMIYCEQGL